MTPETSFVNADQFETPTMGSGLAGVQHVFLCAGCSVKINDLNRWKSLYIRTPVTG